MKTNFFSVLPQWRFECEKFLYFNNADEKYIKNVTEILLRVIRNYYEEKIILIFFVEMLQRNFTKKLLYKKN